MRACSDSETLRDVTCLPARHTRQRKTGTVGSVVVRTDDSAGSAVYADSCVLNSSDGSGGCTIRIRAGPTLATISIDIVVAELVGVEGPVQMVRVSMASGRRIECMAEWQE